MTHDDAVQRLLRTLLLDRLKLRRTFADTLKMTSISGLVGSVNPRTAQSSGLNAIAAGTRQLDADAQQMANPNGADDTAPLVDLNQALLLARAGADVISTENKMLGSLFDAFG